jgi:myo-inositol-1(or 4)-monophosphatase
MSFDLEQALAVARKAAQEAGVVALEGFRKQKLVETKSGPMDLVTEYDRRAEDVLRAHLTEAFPEHAIVGEEGGGEHSMGLTWYLDPIDGTTNFVHGHPFFNVSIGLWRGTEPLVGVVNAPALGLTWWGARGKGAFRNDEPLRVSACDELGRALCATGFTREVRRSAEDNIEELNGFLRDTHGVRRGGASALDLAMVADGTFEVYWQKGLSPWDVAAGVLLVLEAGGKVTGYDGQGGEPRDGEILATNGRLHGPAAEILHEARRRREAL